MNILYIGSIAVVAVTFGDISSAEDITPVHSDQILVRTQDVGNRLEVAEGATNVHSSATSSVMEQDDDSRITEEFERLNADGKYEKAARLLMKKSELSGLSSTLRMKLLETQEKLGWATKAMQSIATIYIHDPKPEYLAKIAIMAYGIGDRDVAETLATSLLGDSAANTAVKRDMAFMMVHTAIDRFDLESAERHLELLQEYSGGDEEAIPQFKAILQTAKGEHEEAIRSLVMAAKSVGGPADDLEYFTKERFGVLREKPEYWTSVKIIIERTEHERKQRDYLYDAIRKEMGKKGGAVPQ